MTSPTSSYTPTHPSPQRRRRRRRWARWTLVGAFGATLTGCAVDASTEPPRQARSASLPGQADGTLTAAEQAGLLLMREEEKLARDLYVALGQRHDLPVFERIAQSEQRHMDAVANLLDRYDLSDPAAGQAAGAFTDPEIQKLYDDLLARGSQSLVEALRVGALVEEVDIADLREQLDATHREDLRLVYDNLLRGSRNHLRAFVRNLDAEGESYTAQHLPDGDVAAIVAADHEPGSGRRGGGRGAGWGQGRGGGWR